MASQTQVVGITAGSLSKTQEKGHLAGANRTQGLGLTAFLVGFTAFTGGLYSGKVLLYLAAVALIAASIWLFRRCRPWEERES